jgi:GIY-YIG catalytic domain-containing protein
VKKWYHQEGCRRGLALAEQFRLHKLHSKRLEERMPCVLIEIVFEWSAWHSWETIAAFKNHRARGPVPAQAGVYEIRRNDGENQDERLYIGSSRNLQVRLYDDLMNKRGGQRAMQKRQGFVDEVSGQTELLAIRWAVTEDYQALERYLHRQYRQQFGHLPKYVR